MTYDDVRESESSKNKKLYTTTALYSSCFCNKQNECVHFSLPVSLFFFSSLYFGKSLSSRDFIEKQTRFMNALSIPRETFVFYSSNCWALRILFGWREVRIVWLHIYFWQGFALYIKGCFYDMWLVKSYYYYYIEDSSIKLKESITK